MAKLEGVEKALREVAESIGITQQKMNKRMRFLLTHRLYTRKLTVIKFLWDTEVRPF